MDILLERIEYYRKKAERNLYLLTSQSLYAEYLILTGNYDKSLLISLKGLLNSPWFFRLQIDLGLSYLLKRELNSAKEEFKHALKIDPENPLAHMFLALTYIKMDRLREAEAILETGIDYNPDIVYIKDLLNNIYRKQGKSAQIPPSEYKRMEEKVKEGFISSSSILNIKREKGDRVPYEILYAVALMQEDKLSDAISVLESILIYHPYYPKALYTLGKVYSIIGDDVRKRENWKKAFEVNPVLPELKDEIKNIESVLIDINDIPEMMKVEELLLNYVFKECEKLVETPEKGESVEIGLSEEETPEEKKAPETTQLEKEEVHKEIKEEIKPAREGEKAVIEEVGKGESEKVTENAKTAEDLIVDYKKRGMEYLKKKMYKEAIEMFTKALKEGKEKI